ncbi:non-ribosomal peptide synthetase/type I polyketide synthase [Actinophytocola oryzae]|uniref:Hybrid polyketide synthase/nonribosomal peptide synthetase FtdB n=1 Tax=Actinophytocola oryzae TaxID=502181 RepID=A0A4R7VXL3_9PSEU|nr:non-ribosomal peptide synthetase/type I polyketide synthase [Actinophytocola oryzae]TDV54219.1 hybrid polyketide synthase/nonribosomal peptide synthetase FtdB [Actinophytocola oryzae]
MTGSSTAKPDKFAIIGIGCRLPGGASDHRKFWQNLVDGKDCIEPTPADRYDVTTLGSRDKAKAGRLVGGRGGYIDGFDEFEPTFFGISPREAGYMDPQQRKLLEVTWEALEDGGQRPADLAGGDVGVFVGAFTLDYKIVQFADLGFETLAAHTATGTMMTMVSNRISHCFDFRGPSVSLDSACSSSLVAVHLACQSLRSGETDLALAGGTLLHMTPQYTIAETKGGFLSPEGRSRTFDAAANGYVRAEGVAMVAIKRLADALRDDDPIHAVIIGSGVNQDGRTDGITVPSAEAQVSLIRKVCGEAGISPGDLQYVEAHGTSTPVGDPIEANALGRALAIGRAKDAGCYVGSVKTNIGHTESAAGIAGLIKTALALEHRLIPAHINLERVNPDIDLESMPFDIPTEATAWPAHEGPARAGVNSFGFGGTNAHVLLEEPPGRVTERPAAQERPGYAVLPLSTRDPAGLPELAEGLRRELAREGVSLADLGHTLAHRRQHLESRLSVVYSTRESLDDALAAVERGEPHPRVLQDRVLDVPQRRVVWVFTGMGPQWWAMGRQLYETEPVYRDVIDRCDREMRRIADFSLIDELNADEADSAMAQTWLAQTANFALQIGLAALWRANGVTPDAIVGHSTGEVAAFYEAGVYSLADAVRVTVHRSRLQQRLVGTGTMLAVSLGEEEATRLVRPFGDRVSLAAVNSPTSTTLAGDEDALAEIASELRTKQVFNRLLSVQVPYHSAHMDRIKDELLSSLDGLAPRRAEVPLYLTGRDGVAHGTELGAEYWWDNVRDHVRFNAAVDRLVDDGFRLFLEIGPHPVLAHSIREILEGHGVTGHVVPSIRRQEDETERFALSVAALHNLGVEVDWQALQPTGRPVPLPRYPWRRDRYWVEPKPVEQIRLGRRDHPLLGRRMASAEPTWEARLDVEAMPYLEDHRIQGNVLFPAAGYLEMATQAVLAMTGGTGATLAEIRLRKALFLSDTETRAVRLGFSSEDAAFTIATATDETQDRVVHASGVVRVGQHRPVGTGLDMTRVRARAEQYLDGPACYTALAELGYHYGPAFQGIQEVWIGRDEALARIAPTEAVEADAEGHHFHPVLLDASFQTLLTPLLLAGRDDGDTGIRLPMSIDEMRVDRVGNQPLWVHAAITGRGTDELVGDITVYADDGTPLGRVTGFRATDVEKAATTVGTGTIDNWLAELTWTERPPLEEQDPGGNWLVLADSGGLAERFATLVADRGGSCHLVRPGHRYRFGRHESTVTPGSAEDLERLLADLEDQDGAGFDAVVHLWNLDLPPLADLTRDEIDRHTSLGGYSLVTLAQTMLARRLGGRLHVVTRGTQAVEPGAPVEPLGARAWGIGRVLWYQELATQHGKLVDLDPTAPAGPASLLAEAEALLRELSSTDEDEIALRGTRRLTSRLLPVTDLTRPLPPRLRPDGSYLVTGAFGALGRVLCRTLVARGARRLILVGRTRLPERAGWGTLDPDSPAGRAVAFVRELESRGAQPILAPLDITDEDQLVDWLADYRRGQAPPIRGVFHLAGQVRDTPVPDMDRQAFDAAHDPKVVGGWLLHRHLRDEPLEHFVLFASIASLLTTAGQTNYAAGNAFLDALAHHRRASGLPALSIDWGPWATGMIEELGLIGHYRDSRGMSSLSPDAGMAVLERVIGQDRAQLLVATVDDWPVFLSWYPSPPPLVAELATSTRAAEPADCGFLEVFREADADKRRTLVVEQFTALVSSVLRVPVEQVEPAGNLTSVGLDSLLAMELRAKVNTVLGVTLPLVALLSGTSVDELVEQLHAGLLDLVSADDAAESSSVTVYTDRSRFPLTQNQKALWFLKQLNPDGFAYNIGGAVEMHVELDPELMFEAVRAMVARHPSLRTNFVLEEGQASQRVADEAVVDVGMVDVQDRSWDEIYRMIIEEYRKPYDLETDPLLRFRLFKRGPDRWVMMKAVHHIISDAVSTFTFIEELLAVYEGLRRGERVELPEPAAYYLDFLNWQNRFLASPDAGRMLEYWRGHLPAEVPSLNLLTDKPRPVVQTHNGASEFFVLDRALSARVRALAREHNVTVFMVLLAAYYVMLHRYSGQDDIIVGSPVTGRTRKEFDSVYGYLVNPLPLRADLSGEPTIAELIAQVQTTVLNGLDNQEYPFVLMVEKLGLRHDPSRSAVFQAMFILLAHKVATEKYGYRLEYIELPEEEGQFDLTLSAYEDEADQRFHCVFKYNTDLFLADTVRRMSTHYVNLLTELTERPGTDPIDRLGMLAPAERDVVLGEWSGAARRIPAEATVPAMVSRVAERTPDAVAVSAPGTDDTTRQLTYGEVDRRSTELARRLHRLGVRDGAVVALCLDKSPELVVTLLAVLKAGGAYLPLDPEYPADRLSYMVEVAGARLVVVDEAEHERLSGLAERVLTVADLDIGNVSGVELAPVRMDQTAYVIYTSGSTGRPKAVRVTHRNLASVQAGWREEYRLDTDVRVHLQMASPAFDVFTGDLVRALCSGATLVLADHELLFDTARLYTTMVTERVDCAEFVPAIVRGLMSYCERHDRRLDFMRLMIVGSDTWKVAEYQRLRALCGPDTRVVNSYGVSEATIDTTYFEGPVDELEPSRTVPIGRPFPNSAVYLLDERGEPVPAGIPGELWVGGTGVSEGYVGSQEQTAKRFVTRDLDGEPMRLYRTGDLARWTAAGELELLGRADSQVKVRGHRVEIGEIETRLAGWPGLAQAVVAMRPDGRGEDVLCAYYVPQPGTELNRRELRAHLAGYLPTFMIPSYFVEMPGLPLTPNGKVDVAALPAPRAEADEQEYEAPVTFYEVRMVERWKALLGLDQVGLRHDFFEVGGSSIKLIELIYALQAEFSVAIPVSQLFKITTLHGMARAVELMVNGRIGSAEPYLTFNAGQGDPVFCFPPAGGHGLVYRTFATHLREHEFVSFNYLAGEDKPARFADLVESAYPQGPCTVLGYSLGGNIAFEVAKELERRGRTVSHVVIIDSHRIPEAIDLGAEYDEYFALFEQELGEHLRRHTGSETVVQDTLDQAREYIHYCARTPNLGTVTAPVTLVSDRDKVDTYDAGEHGSWHGSSATGTRVVRGHGTHAEMLDKDHAEANAAVVREIMAAKEATNAP